MDVKQLAHFAAVAEERSFTRAAGMLGISQPGLSASVRALERDIGMALLERTTRQVVVTSAGRVLWESAQLILDEIARAQRRLDALAGMESGSLGLGVVQTFTSVDLPAVLADLHRHHPGIQVTLREAPTADLLHMVRVGELDLAFVALDDRPPPGGLDIVRRYAEEIMVVVGAGHRLAGRTRVRLDGLAREVFVDFQAGQGLQTVIEGVCERAGLDRTIGFGVEQIDRVVALVGHGLGVALVPEPIARGCGLPVIRVSPRPPTRDLALVARSGNLTNPAADAFVSLLPG